MCACVYRGRKEARVLCEKPMGELTSNKTSKTVTRLNWRNERETVDERSGGLARCRGGRRGGEKFLEK